MRLVIDPHILENAFYYGSNDHFELTQEMVLLIHDISYVYELAQKFPQPKPRAKIFISYKSEDRKFAELIDSEFKREGYNSWFDRAELKGGDVWWDEIIFQINQAVVFLPILTEWAVKVPGYHKNELELAREKQNRGEAFIVPIKVGRKFNLSPDLNWLESLHTISAYGDWFGNLRNAVDNAIGRKAEIVALAEERERTCLCIDENDEYSEAIGRYRSILENEPPIEITEQDMSPIEKFEKWKQILECFEAVRPHPGFITPSLETEIYGHGCRDRADGIFVKLAIGAEGHLVSEGGVTGKCRRNHEWTTCPTAECLGRINPGKVLCARDVLNRLKDRRRELENLARTWRMLAA